jgi:hypothetical protein
MRRGNPSVVLNRDMLPHLVKEPKPRVHCSPFSPASLAGPFPLCSGPAPSRRLRQDLQRRRPLWWDGSSNYWSVKDRALTPQDVARPIGIGKRHFEKGRNLSSRSPLPRTGSDEPVRSAYIA